MSTIFRFAEAAAQTLALHSWQVGALILGVAVVTSVLRRARPAIRHALWLVVLVRLCLPAPLETPLGLGTRAVSAVEHSTRGSEVPPLVQPHEQESKFLTSAPPPAPSAVAPGTQGELPDSISAKASPALRMTLWTWLGIIWAAGTACLAAVCIFRSIRLYRVARESTQSRSPVLTSLLDDLRERLGIRRTVQLKMLPTEFQSLGPCATGVLRPAILIPSRMAEDWESSAIEPVLLHELAHIRRGDVLVQCVQLLTQVVYWFHPLVWFANSRLRHERELLCDDLAVAHSGGSSRKYGASLVRALEECRVHSSWQLVGVGIGESRIRERLSRLLDGKYRVPRPLNMVTATLVIACGVLGALVASSAETKPKAEQPVVSHAAPTAELPPLNKPTVQIRIVDPAGKPVEGAVILPSTLQARGGDIVWQTEKHGPLEPVRTNADGIADVVYPRFVAGEIPTESLTVVIDHPHFCQMRHHGYRVAGEQKPLMLKPGAALKVSGYHDNPRTPVRDLIVQTATANYAERLSPQSWKEVQPGVLRSQQLPEGEVWVRLVEFSGDTPVRFSEATRVKVERGSTQRLNLFLKPGVRLEGTLDSSVPRPIKDGWMSVVISAREIPDTGHGNYRDRLEWYTGAEIQADGSFLLPALPPGDAALIAGCVDYVSRSGQPDGSGFRSTPQFFLLEGNVVKVQLQMERSGIAEIRVLDQKKRPVASASVGVAPNVSWSSGISGLFARTYYDTGRYLRSGKEPLPAPPVPTYSGTTNAEGVVRISNLPAGTHSYSVTPPDKTARKEEDWFQSRNLSVKSGEVSTITVELPGKEAAKAKRHVAMPKLPEAGKPNLFGLPARSNSSPGTEGLSATDPAFRVFEMRLVTETPTPTSKAYLLSEREGHPERILLEPGAVLDQSAIQSASFEQGTKGKLVLLITLTSAGNKKFADLTTAHVGKRFAVILDGKLHAAPVIAEPIRGGSIAIAGEWTTAEARKLVAKLTPEAVESNGGQKTHQTVE